MESQYVSVVDLPPGFGQRACETARRCLEGISEVRSAGVEPDICFKVIQGLPLVILAFHIPETEDQPALAVSLCSVREGTLADALPGKKLFEGDRLRDRILFCLDDYLTKNGVRILNPAYLS